MDASDDEKDGVILVEEDMDKIIGLRCNTTGNLCGTDTWERHYICQCRNCQEWMSNDHKRLNEENAKLSEEINNMSDNSWFERKMEKLGSTHAFKDERIRLLEEENAKLQAEIADLRESMELSAKSYSANMCGWQEDNANLRVEIERIKDEDAAKDDKMLEMEGRYKKELDTFREVLRKISEWGCNGQCMELIKTKCPCCIATEFLENKELQNGKSTE